MDDQCLVVVVDDEPEIREIMQLMIENAGYKVETVSNDDEDRILALASRAKLFLIDLGAPSGSGLELVRKLDVKNSPFEVIVMTGGAQFDWIQKADGLGVVGYLHKPFSSKKLIRQMEIALASAAQKAQTIASTHNCGT
jgi:DNA-binding NtrC family response regulator